MRATRPPLSGPLAASLSVGRPLTPSQTSGVVLSSLRLLVAFIATASLHAQVPSATASAAVQSATAALNIHLGIKHLREVSCVAPAVANCAGGLEVVQSFQLGSPVLRGDSLWLPVRLEVLGVIASSEASLMFLPDHSEPHLDSGTVTMVRRGARWTPDTLRVLSERPVTSVAAVRAFFHLDAEDRRLLDSTVRTRQRSSQRPPNER